MTKAGKRFFRLVVPAFPDVSVYSVMSGITTALGPVLVATMVKQMLGWDVEVIDENNWHGARDASGFPDHELLQKENPADAVGVFCGISSSIERAYQVASFYKEKGILTVAGGRHAYFLPKEALENGFDVVFHGEAEFVFPLFLRDYISLGRACFAKTQWISYLKEGRVRSNLPDLSKGYDYPENVLQVLDLDSVPIPDFGLVRCAKILIYPVCKCRGCAWHCEFCSVNCSVRSASAEHAFETVRHLVERFKAKTFFIVDDHFSEDPGSKNPKLRRIRETALRFCKLIAAEYGDKLAFVFQARLTDVEDEEVVFQMKRAGFFLACLGVESPFRDDLKAMRKGYSAQKMVELSLKWRKTGILRQFMLIASYPVPKGQPIAGPKKATTAFKDFLRVAKPDFIQVFLSLPIPGSQLRKRLMAENRLLPLSAVPWKYFDGAHLAYVPIGAGVRELQEVNVSLMEWFYNPWQLFAPLLRWCMLPLCLFYGWKKWHRLLRRDRIMFIGYWLVRKWRQNQKRNDPVGKIESYLLSIKQPFP